MRKINLVTALSIFLFSPFVSFAADQEQKSGKKPETEAGAKPEKGKAKSEDATEEPAKGKSQTVKSKEKSQSESATSKAKGKGKTEKEGSDEAAAEKEEAKKLASGLTKTQREKLTDLLNEGTSEQLEAIDGISASKADAIIKGRPFNAVEDVIAVKGIGKVLYSNIISHGKSSSNKGKGKAKE